MRFVSLKALLMLFTFALGSITVSGTVLPLGITDASRSGGNFVLAVSPSSVAVQQGLNATTTVTVYSLQRYTGTVVLNSRLASGNIVITFSPGKLRVPAGGTISSVVTMRAAKNATPGVYTVIITGTGGAGKRVLSSSALLTVNVNSSVDFALYASPYSVTIVAGLANSTNIVLESKQGYYGAVSLSATVPFGFLGVMGGQNPIRLTPGGTAYTTLVVSTTNSTLPGKYNITITGVSGAVSHLCILTVIVTDPLPESLSLSGFSFGTPTNMTLSLHNNGNTPIILQSYRISDATGDTWTLSPWSGPTIAPGGSGTATILVGLACNYCSYTGIFGLFQQYVPGQTYTVTITTSQNVQFSFRVTR